MAIMTPGPLVGRISGNLAGLNFAQTKTGLIARRRLHRVDHATEPQFKARMRFRYLQRLWRNLDEEDRIAWQRAAALATFQNRLGIRRTITPSALFIKVGLERPDTLTPNAVLPTTLNATANLQDVYMTLSAAGAYNLYYTSLYSSVTNVTYVYALRSWNTAPRAFNGRWHYFGTFNATLGSSSWNFKTAWEAQYGLCNVGEWIWLRLRQRTTGRLSSSFQTVSAQVTA